MMVSEREVTQRVVFDREGGEGGVTKGEYLTGNDQSEMCQSEIFDGERGEGYIP